MNNLNYSREKKKTKTKQKTDKCKKCWKGANECLDSGKAKNSICLKWLRKNSWQRPEADKQCKGKPGFGQSGK